MNKINNKLILNIIRYTPLLFVLLLVLSISSFLSYDHTQILHENQKSLKENYLKHNKQIIKYTILTITNYIEKELSTSKIKLKSNLETNLNIAYKITQSIYKKNKDSKTQKEIQIMINNALREIRFNDGRGYYFIHTMDGINLLHPILPQREGSNIGFQKDKNGIQRFQVLKNSVLNKDGYSNFNFYHVENKQGEQQKILYAKHFKPLNIMIGTGEYMIEFNKQVQSTIINHLNNIQYQNYGYIFILTKKGNILASDNKSIDGHNISEYKRFVSFSHKFSKFVDSDKTSAYIQYQVKKGIDDSHQKISFIHKNEKLGWIIGTGFNLKRAYESMRKDERKLQKKYDEYIQSLLFISLFVTIFLFLISYYISKIIEIKFINYQDKLIHDETKRYDFLLNQLHEILDSLPIMIIYKDTKNNILKVNQSTADSLHKTKEELTNVPSSYIFPNDYEKYYMDDLEIISTKKEKIGLIERYESKDGIKTIETSKIPLFNDNGDVKGIIVFINDITEILNKEEELQDTTRKLYDGEIEKVENYQQTIESLVELIEQRDFYTAGHSYRVADYSVAIALELGFNTHDIYMLRQIGLLHDIGKIGIPDSILLKPGQLAQQEYEIIQSHVLVGYNIIAKIPMFKDFAEIILCHHERHDGTGYPYGIKGDEIPTLAQVLAIADSFDAMTTTRIYNKKKSVKDAINEIKKESGKLFNPKIVDVAVKVFKYININIHRTQFPETPIEKERFAYYFKDVLTDLHNENYLKLILEQKKERYKSLSLIVIHKFSKYNEEFGWDKGNEVLICVANLLKKSYETNEICRYHGVNFTLLNDNNTDINIEDLNKLLEEYNLTFELYHFDINEFNNGEELFVHLNMNV